MAIDKDESFVSQLELNLNGSFIPHHLTTARGEDVRAASRDERSEPCLCKYDQVGSLEAD